MMPILNYTTSIKAEKTFSEIQFKLAQAKAQAVLCEYDKNGIMNAISFRINTPSGLISYRLPSNIDGVENAIRKNRTIPNRFKTREQAVKVAWRILKDWVEAQLAIVEAGLADLKEVFLPYAQNQNGQTVYEWLSETKFKMLTGPTSNMTQKG